MSDILQLQNGIAALRVRLQKIGASSVGLKREITAEIARKNMQIANIQRETDQRRRAELKLKQADQKQAAQAAARAAAIERAVAEKEAEFARAEAVKEAELARIQADKEAELARIQADKEAELARIRAQKEAELTAARSKAKAEMDARLANNRAFMESLNKTPVPKSGPPIKFGSSAFHVSPDGIATIKPDIPSLRDGPLNGLRLKLTKQRTKAEAMMPRQRSGMCYVHALYNAVLNNPLLYDAMVRMLKSRTEGMTEHYADLGVGTLSPFGKKDDDNNVDELVRAILVEKDKKAFQWARDVISLTTLLAAPSLSKQQRAEFRSNKDDAARLITTVSLGEVTSKTRYTGEARVKTFDDAESFAKWGDGGHKLDALLSFLRMSGLTVHTLQRGMSGNYDEYLVTLPGREQAYALIRKRMNSCVGEGLHGYDTSGILGETLEKGGQHATCYYRVADDGIVVLDSNWTEGAGMTPVCQLGAGGVGPRRKDVPVDDYISILVGSRYVQRGGAEDYHPSTKIFSHEYGADIDDDVPTEDTEPLRFELDDLDMLKTIEDDIDFLEVLPKLDLDEADLEPEQEDAYELAVGVMERLLELESSTGDDMEGGGSSNWSVAAALLGVTIATALFA